MKEKEWKGLIDKKTYERLLLEKWDNAFVQVNFYYSNKTLKENENITIRIRCINNIILLQVKVKTKINNNNRVSEEYEKILDIVPYKIPEEEIKNICKDYCYGDVILLGFLITERRIKQINNIEVALDRNTYNNVTDYEIELEYKNDYNEVLEVIKEIDVEKQTRVGMGKYHRFVLSME